MCMCTCSVMCFYSFVTFSICAYRTQWWCAICRVFVTFSCELAYLSCGSQIQSSKTTPIVASPLITFILLRVISYCVCMFVCVHMCIYVHTCMRVFVCMCLHAYSCVYNMFVWIRLDMYVCMYVCLSSWWTCWGQKITWGNLFPS